MDNIKKSKENVLAILFIFSVPLLNIIYTVTNGGNREVYNLVTDIDNKIPFIKYFILPYNMWYPFVITSLFYMCFAARKLYFKTVIAIDIGLICCYIVYILFQTTVPRPELHGNDIITSLVRITYKMDEPFNCFPSIHVMTSYIVMKAVHRSKIKNLFAVGLIYTAACTIILSTLFVKQHVIMDAFSGILLGNVVFYLAGLINEERIFLWTKKQFLSLMMKKKLET